MSDNGRASGLGTWLRNRADRISRQTNFRLARLLFALLLVMVVVLTNSVQAVAEHLLTIKQRGGEVLLWGVASLTVLGWSAHRRANGGRRRRFLPSYSAIAVCFFVTPSGLLCLGYFMSGFLRLDSSTEKARDFEDALFICTTFMFWWVAVGWCDLVHRHARNDRRQFNARIAGTVVVGVAAGFFCLCAMKFPGLAARPGVILFAGSLGLVNAYATWMKSVVALADCEGLEVDGPG